MAASKTTKDDPLISLSGVGINRSGRWLIRGVDLSVRPGEIVTLIGPNGSGKTTTAKAAIGLLTTDEGTASRAPGLTIGYVPQRLAIDSTMPLTVARLMTVSGRAAKEDIAGALDAAGVGHLAAEQMHDLSGGETQRVLLARAMLHRPRLLVLDEPVQGVDFSGALALYDLIANFRDETGAGILLISHDLHFVMASTDTVICLNGHVCCTGTPESVAASPEYVQLFGPRAVDSLAVYHHHHDHTHLPDGRVRHADGTVTDHCHPEDGHHHGEHTETPAARRSEGEKSHA